MKKQILVLDGGFATGLETYFQKNLTGDLWSASILLKDPDVIRKLHLLYYEAGADIAITCSYQASIDGFMKLGLSGMESETLIKKSVQLANEAKLEFTQKSGRKVLVAASLGSYGALLANGK
ncbi:Homocysteine S-methyltransferase 1 [Globomyces sp. JEL0801]|nr:Homocysteine S-methyltransferase 1 [Globomyces sp. JEL0801]